MTTIAFDLDDTLVDTMSTLLEWIETRLGLRISEEKLATYELGANASETDAIVEAFHADRTDQKIRAHQGAVDACRQLGDAGFRLVVVTSRKPAIAVHTIDLVERLFPGIFAEIHSLGYPADKTATLRKIDAGLFIDDHFGHVEGAGAAGIPSILFGDLPWNRGSQWDHRAVTWPQALALSRTLLRGAEPQDRGFLDK